MKYSIGGIVDEQLPDLGDLLPPEVCKEDFSAWLAPLIGYYRSQSDFDGQTPPVAEQKRELEAFRRNLADIIKLTEPGGMSHDSNGRLWDDAYQRRLNLDNTMADFCAMARRLLIVVDSARKDMEPLKDRKGPKSRRLRDTLVEDVTQKLCSYGMGLNAARLLTLEILARCRVPVNRGDGAENAIRSMRRAGDKIKQK